MTTDEIVSLLRKMPEVSRRRWCDVDGGCACMGCANQSGGLAKAGVTREQYEAALRLMDDTPR